MLQAPKRYDNSFRLSGAAAGEQYVKRVIALRADSRSGRVSAGKFCDVFRRENQRRTRDCENFVDALLWQYRVQRDIWPVGFYRSQKRDEHLRLSMPQHRDGGAIVAEAFYQVRREGI
jgi:hypothetical protein